MLDFKNSFTVLKAVDVLYNNSEHLLQFCLICYVAWWTAYYQWQDWLVTVAQCHDVLVQKVDTSTRTFSFVYVIVKQNAALIYWYHTIYHFVLFCSTLQGNMLSRFWLAWNFKLQLSGHLLSLFWQCKYYSNWGVCLDIVIAVCDVTEVISKIVCHFFISRHILCMFYLFQVLSDNSVFLPV